MTRRPPRSTRTDTLFPDTTLCRARGLPRECDLVFDVRFLQNRHYVRTLRDRTGQDPDYAAYVEADAGFRPFLDNLLGLLAVLLPRYESEGKAYLTIAFGRSEERRVGKECVGTCISRWSR